MAPVDPCVFRCAGEIVFVALHERCEIPAFEHFDGLLLRFFEGQGQVRWPMNGVSCRFEPDFEFAKRNRTPEDPRSLQNVAKLSHIAGPSVALQLLEGRALDGPRGDASSFVEVADERQKILDAFP